MNIKDNFKIIIKKENLKINETGLATGTIFFDINGYYFPESTWNDFVVIVMHWWVEAALNLCLKRNKSIELYFMDGPYKLKITLIDSDKCEVECIRTSDDEILKKMSVSFQEIISSISKSSEFILSNLRHIKDEVDGYASLENAYNFLNELTFSKKGETDQSKIF